MQSPMLPKAHPQGSTASMLAFYVLGDIDYVELLILENLHAQVDEASKILGGFIRYMSKRAAAQPKH